MKSTFKILALLVFLVTAPFILRAQNPPHPNNGAAPTSGSGNTPVGGATAPVGSGSLILIALAAAYGGKRIYTLHTEEKQD